MVFLDTNIIIRLYNGDKKLLSKKAARLIEDNNIYISPMVILELEYLYEIKRVNTQANQVVDYLSSKIGLGIEDQRFNEIIKYSIMETWTRDPFDRIIVSHAKSRDAYLISTDRNIKKNYKKAVL